MSLGADRAAILALVLREAAVLLAVGLVIGIGLALATGNAAAAFLFGLKPTDVTTFGLATCGLAIVAFAASYVPALRASKLDPVEALRHE
jgi:ABC-type antimicrobial peptide transport system permease subunit